MALAVTTAHADPSFYTEIGYAWPKIDSSGYSVTPSDGLLRLGYNMTDHFAVEAFGATSLRSADLFGVAIKIDNAYGAYLKGQWEVAPSFELFAKTGWVHATLAGAAYGVSASSSDDSFSYGVGAQYRFTPNWYGQVDYLSYYDKNGDTIRGPSISIGYRY
jgi:outer membrane autotransporter protein